MDSHAEPINIIIVNYKTLEKTWEEAPQVTQNTEAKARILGVAAQKKSFMFFYRSMLSELVLEHIRQFELNSSAYFSVRNGQPTGCFNNSCYIEFHIQ